MEREQVVICIATGPSLTEEDCKAIQGKGKVVAVNDAWQLAPFADLLYACDQRWWQHHLEAIRAAGFAGQLWTQVQEGRRDKSEEQWAKEHGIHVVEGAHKPGLGRELIFYGNNSGYQAINLAWLQYKPERMILLGYDMSVAPNGKRHFFGDHPPPLHVASDYSTWARNFDQLARDLAAEGVEVINCSRRTAIKAFTCMALEDAL